MSREARRGLAVGGVGLVRLGRLVASKRVVLGARELRREARGVLELEDVEAQRAVVGGEDPQLAKHAVAAVAPARSSGCTSTLRSFGAIALSLDSLLFALVRSIFGLFARIQLQKL